MKGKYKSAASLFYDETSGEAPILSARGEEVTADKIVSIAQRYGIPVVEDAQLADSLCKLEEGDEIPEELFQPVAIVLNKIIKAK